MNSKDLFNKAVIKTNMLPELIDTPKMRRQVMMSTVAEWLFQLDVLERGEDAHASILKMVFESMTLINEYLNKEDV